MSDPTPSEGELVARSYFFYTVFGVIAFAAAVIVFVLR
jgi:hypothetical protein